MVSTEKSKYRFIRRCRYLVTILVFVVVIGEVNNVSSKDDYPLPMILNGRRATLVITIREPWIGGTADSIHEQKMAVDLPALLQVLNAMEKVIKTSPFLDAFLMRFHTLGQGLSTPTKLFTGSIEYPPGKTIEDIWQDLLDPNAHQTKASDLYAPLAQAAACRTRRLERHSLKGRPSIRDYADCSSQQGSIEVIGDMMPRDNDALMFIFIIDPKVRDREIAIFNDMLETLRIVK